MLSKRDPQRKRETDARNTEHGAALNPWHRGGSAYETERLIRMGELTQIVGLGRSTIYRLIAAGKFPQPIHPFPKISAWRLSAVESWIARRIAGEPI